MEFGSARAPTAADYGLTGVAATTFGTYNVNYVAPTGASGNLQLTGALGGTTTGAAGTGERDLRARDLGEQRRQCLEQDASPLDGVGKAAEVEHRALLRGRGEGRRERAGKRAVKQAP